MSAYKYSLGEYIISGLNGTWMLWSAFPEENLGYFIPSSYPESPDPLYDGSFNGQKIMELNQDRTGDYLLAPLTSAHPYIVDNQPEPLF